jgi:macrodomain Ter protein organizer (MatP/YcbG family)
MNAENTRKTLVDIPLPTWAKVRYFATIKELSINEAVELLLAEALRNCNYVEDVVASTKNMVTSRRSRHPIPPGAQH